MLGYFCKRILLIIPTVMAVILLVFVLMASLMGTDTSRMIRYEDDVPGEEPRLSLLQQYGKYCFRVFVRGDFGENDSYNSPLGEDLMERTAVTLRMTGISVIATYLLGLPLGILAACRRGRWQDRLITSLTTFFSALPSFCLALGFVLLFSLRLRWVNVTLQNDADYLIPLATLAIAGAANVAKVTRAGMAEALDRPFILSLRSLGLSRRSVIFRHALKSALIPAFSVFGTVCANLICGSIVVERFFNIRGLGSCIIGAVGSRATTTLMGCMTIVALIMCVLSVAADLLFVIIDPSLRKSLTFGSTLRRRGER